MNKTDFNKQVVQIKQIADKYLWRFESKDVSTSRVSFIDEFKIYRIDLYLSKMTICLICKGEKTIYLKKQTTSQIEKVFKQPYSIKN